MKIQIENLKAFMSGKYEFSIYQKADAIVEFNKLVAYVEELEQLNLVKVCQDEKHDCAVSTSGFCTLCQKPYLKIAK